jgi:hypothetical protein
MFDVLRLPSEKIVAAVGGRTVPSPAFARRGAAPEKETSLTVGVSRP